jgi:hypothetical protein
MVTKVLYYTMIRVCPFMYLCKRSEGEEPPRKRPNAESPHPTLPPTPLEFIDLRKDLALYLQTVRSIQ